MVTSRIGKLVAMNKSKTRGNPTVEWNQINWQKAERLTFKLHSSYLSYNQFWIVSLKKDEDIKERNEAKVSRSVLKER